MQRLMFYFQYAARNLWRSRRWSTFGVFSIAAGVATMVALRSLGLAIGDSLTENIRSSNKGDLTVKVEGDGFALAARSPEDIQVFTEAQLQTMRALAASLDARVTEYSFNGGAQVTKLDAQTIGKPQFINAFYIDPATYPVTADIYALDPPGVPLGQLFQGGNEVVVSQNLAEREQIAVGDTVRVTGTEALFIVRGIVPTEAQAGLRQLISEEFLSVIFGFAYFDRALAGTVLPVNPGANRVSFVLPDGTPPEQIMAAEDNLRRSLPGDRYFVEIDTTPELLYENQFIADVISRFVVVMGLGAMLIGGVGIINTTLVMVRRRTEEIAALKTFGLKARQVSALFMAEAFLLGLMGSLVGGLVGTLLGGMTNRFGAALIQQSLPWRIYPEAILFGLALGVIVTVVFGVLPVLMAARVRPAIILRPNETHIAPIGFFQALVAIYLVVVSMGLIAGQIVGNVTAGIIGVAVTIALLGILAGFLWIVVWLIGKLPTFGWVEMRLALRNLSTRRMRTATTLLALSAGMAALSGIAFFGAGVSEIINFTFTRTLGGNVLILPLLPSNFAQPLIDGRIATLEGVEYRTQLKLYDGRVRLVDGREPYWGDFQFVNLTERNTGDPNPPATRVEAGRALTPEDSGQRVAVIAQSRKFEDYVFQPGQVITVDVFGQNGAQGRIDLEIVGVAPGPGLANASVAFSGDIQVPMGTLESLGFSPDFQLNLVQVAPESLNEALLGLSSLPLTFSFDISFVDSVFRLLIDQFSAVPILVGLLSLGAAAVIMANTVALATLERRRQIGILKAIGLKGDRVLRIMLLENILIALLGAVLGIGLSALGVVVMTAFGMEDVQLIPPDAAPIAILLVLAAVGIGALATFLSASVAVRERVLNVLRYE